MTQRRDEHTTSAPSAREIATAWGLFLHGRVWTHWCTLTADGQDRRGRRRPRVVTEASLRADFVRFVRRLESMTQRPVRWSAIVEGVDAGHPHLHCMLADCESLSLRKIRAAWKAGISTIETYDSAKGGAYYATKAVGIEPDAIEMSDDLPPRLPSDDDASQDWPMLTLVIDRVNACDTSAASRTTRGGRAASLPVERIASTEMVDHHTWADQMADIILRLSGYAA